MMLALTLSLAAGALQPEAPPVPHCPPGKADCGLLGGSEQRADQGLESLDSLAQRNVQIIRIFMEGGFGSRYATTSFVRAPGEEPTVQIARSGDSTGKPALVMPISEDVWVDAISRVAYFDTAARPRADGQLTLPCLHPYSARVEVIDRSSSRGPMRVRQVTQSTCDYGPTFAAAVQLLQKARTLIPSCALLNDGPSADVAAILSFCASMKGDKAAVAQAKNVLDSSWLQRPRTPDYAGFLQHYFYDFAEMTWPGEPVVKGEEQVAVAWATKFSQLYLSPRIWTGLDDHRVEVKGVVFSGQPNVSEDEMPHFTLTMVKENGFDFRIYSLAVTAARR